MIPKFSLSLSAPGLHLLWMGQWILVLASLSFLGASGWIGWESQNLEDHIATLQEAVTRAQRLDQEYVEQARAQGFDLSTARQTALTQEIEFANSLFAHHEFSWTRFLSDLEAAIPLRISMESVSLNFKDGTISLSGAASTLNDLQSMVNHLEEHGAFHDVVVLSHKIKTPDKREKTQKPSVIFSMKVTYQPPSHM